MDRDQEREEYRVSRFACHRCGRCCKGDGVVTVGEQEAPAIAAHLGLSLEQFQREYTRPNEWDFIWLKDKWVEGEQWCVFLEKDAKGRYACAIQAVKPEQCSSFPYSWRPSNAFEWCEGLKATIEEEGI